MRRIARFSLPVTQLPQTIAFYEKALGFALVQSTAFRDRDIATLALGEETIELVRYDPGGAPYPEPRRACDPWFQHFAIAVSDMAAAYARIEAYGGSAAISFGGPQRLPPSTGSVTAYKFRDPEGHPLELTSFPAGVGDPQWQRRERLFLGIDHTAIAVSDLSKSVAFYRDQLGFVAAPSLVNSGPTQARLDGLVDPVVEIVALTPPTGPHLELLAYRGAAPSQASPRPGLRDVAATQTVLDAPVRVRGPIGGPPGPDEEITDIDDGAACLGRDPDGHILRLEAG